MASVELKDIVKAFRRNFEDTAIGKTIEYAFITNAAMKSAVPGQIMEGNLKNNQTYGFKINEINLSIPDGKTLVILGPSGCGKTTLLRMIAGLEQPDSGQIIFAGMDVTSLPAESRKMGMVFQNYALYPHMKARTNILTFFLFHKKTKDMELLKTEKYKKTSELMGIDIEYLLDRKIPNLSGGEKQRIAIARCITRDPAVFLLDEPFSNLDAKLRGKYRIELRKLLSQLKVTTVYVTHDQQEALILADIIAVMDIGKIAQVGTFEELYKNPSSVFVAEFLNPNTETPAINMLDGKSVSPELSGYKVGLHPEDIEIIDESTPGGFQAAVTMVRQVPIKNISVLTLRIGNEEIYIKAPIGMELKIDSTIFLKFKKMYLFNKETGLRVYSADPI